MAEKVPAAQARLLRRIFVCKRCGAKIKADMLKILGGKVKCRKCNSRTFRPKSKGKKIK